MLETAPKEARGGNSAFTGGAFRFVYDPPSTTCCGWRRTSPNSISPTIDFGSYTREQYFDDMGRLTEYRCDPDLTDVLIGNSYDAGLWLRKHGVRFQPALGRQAFKVDGKFKFWGGLACHILGGGQHLVETLHERAGAARHSACCTTPPPWRCFAPMRALMACACVTASGRYDLRAGAVVLACGGFESNAEMRARYLGPNWDLAKVRGTQYNTGIGHRMAIDIGAAVAGHWSGAHAVQWDMNAPPYGDLTVGDRFQKHNYPFGVLVNARGERFLDEGLDFHSYTYAKYGHEVMKQPGLFAWQIFDAKIVHLLREEYRIARITKEQANTLEELAPKLTGVDTAAVLETLRRVQRGAAPRRGVQSEHPRRAAHVRASGRQDQLGAKARHAAIRCLRRHRGRDVHLRRTEDDHIGRGRGRIRHADPRPVCRRRDRGRTLLPQLRQRHRPGRRCGVRSHRRKSGSRVCCANQRSTPVSVSVPLSLRPRRGRNDRVEMKRLLDMRATRSHVRHMSSMIQIRNVPDALHRRLKSRAALAGMSLSDYLLAEIRDVAERPTLDELRARLARRSSVTPSLAPAEAVRAERDQR